uniref:Vomeronasal type-1 receptor n=1 Tax=Rattus norvegicus TaxID=10116 RepID=A0ABK0M3T1_RAT|eukprot:NP_001008954.1 vomeronasal 1 receptor 19 [Rattus norvegicus]
MESRNLAIGMVYLSQTLIGILGNFSLIFHYAFLSFTTSRLKPTDFILKHLIVANSLFVISKGVPQTLSFLGLKDFLNDLVCKITYYAHTVGRGMSISSTCILSVFQAITISSMDSRYARFKFKARGYVGLICAFCWVLFMAVNIIVLMYVTAKRSNRNITNLKDLGFCVGVNYGKPHRVLHSVLYSVPDVLFMGIMIGSSSFMVSFLHRHQHQVQHIHATHVSQTCSSVDQATKTILLLVNTFVCFYLISSITHVIIIMNNSPNWLLVNLAMVFGAGFQTISPFLLMTQDSNASRFSLLWLLNRKSSHLIRKI